MPHYLVRDSVPHNVYKLNDLTGRSYFARRGTAVNLSSWPECC